MKHALLFLDIPGVALQTRRGALCVRQSDGIETHYPARMHGLRVIILAGHGSSITSEAIRWCGREGVALYLMERSGECFAVVTEAAGVDARRRALTMRQKQFAAALDPRKRLDIARKIVRAKLRTLDLHPADARAFRQALGPSNPALSPSKGPKGMVRQAHQENARRALGSSAFRAERGEESARGARGSRRGARRELTEARKLEDILTLEARAGAAFFMQFRGAEMRFDKHSAQGFKDVTPTPSHWSVFTARAGTFLRGSRGTSKARYAATPWGAMLNYAFTVALGQCTRAIIGMGLDPCLGFLHSPKPGRLSLSYDVLELHRAGLTRSVFEYACGHTFRRDGFETDRRGVVRLGAPVAKEIAALALRTAPIVECVKTVRRLMGWF